MKSSKTVAALILIFLMPVAGFVSCKSKPTVVPAMVKASAPQPPDGYKPAEAKPIELPGENCCGQMVGDKPQIVFLSRKRPRHSHFQTYVFDLEAKKERRLSFHDGDDQGPQVDPTTGHFFYASTTDALKESPRFLQEALGKPTESKLEVGRRPLWSGDNFDLYRALRDGTGIQRLTQSPGFDGELRLHPNGQFLIYTTVKNGQSLLVRIDVHGRDTRVLTRVKQSESEASFSPSGKEFAWVRYSVDYTESQIWVANLDGKKARAITSGKGLRWSPSWSPDGQQILFSSNQADPENFELYSVQKEGTCLRRLTYALGQDLLPVWFKNQQQLLFSSDRSGVYQLYAQDFTPPPCPTPSSEVD